MSRQNKVNPGMYTQRGRLSQDDAARELRKQSVISSPHTWQPVHTQMRQRLAPAADAARDTEIAAATETMVETSPQVEARPKPRVTRKMGARGPDKVRATRPRSAKAKTAATRKSKSTPAKAKTGKAKTTAMKRATKPTRKAVRARKVGGGSAAPRRTTKRRKS